MGVRGALGSQGNQEAASEEMLGEAVRSKGQLKIGSELAAFGLRGEFELETTHDQEQPEPAEFE